jgi:hypothetical protein
MSARCSPDGEQTVPWFILGLMASVTFVGILSELVPSGILPQMTEGLGVEESDVGFLVGVYAFASAMAAIPLVSATLAFNRKTLLLMVLLIGFAASNVLVGLSSSHAVIIAFRIDNGIHLAQTMSFDELDRCLDLITYNGAKALNVEDQYGIEEGKPANFLVLSADSPFEAVRQRADVLASIRNGEYLFKRPEPNYEIALNLFRKTN